MTTLPTEFAYGSHSRSARRLVMLTVIVVAAMTAIRIVYACALDLRTDEAYYWTWSKESVLCFLDHPPMLSWMIRLGTALFGDTPFGARFAGILGMFVTQCLLADIARRITGDIRAIVLAVLLPEAAVYYGLLTAKIAPDIAAIPFSVAMLWSLVRLAEDNDPRWWLAAGLFGGLALLSKFTVVMFAPAIIAFVLVPSWRARWLKSPYPYAGMLIALLIFSPVVIWNVQHDFASFRFQLVRATASHGLSLRTFGDYVGLQLGLVGIIVLPFTLFGLVVTARRGYLGREPNAILLSTAVLVPFLYFLWKSLSLRVGDTWPMFVWPIGFAAAAANVTMLPREGWSASAVRSAVSWAERSVVSGLITVALVFLYSVASPWNLFGGADPVGGEAGFEQVAQRARAELAETGATWIATTDYRTYAMMRWHFRDTSVPVVQISERARFQGFADPGTDRIRGHAGLYIAREPDNHSPVWNLIPAIREPLERVDRVWRGRVMDSYALEKLQGWWPDLNPPVDSPLFQWRELARGREGGYVVVSAGHAEEARRAVSKRDGLAASSGPFILRGSLSLASRDDGKTDSL